MLEMDPIHARLAAQSAYGYANDMEQENQELKAENQRLRRQIQVEADEWRAAMKKAVFIQKKWDARERAMIQTRKEIADRLRAEVERVYGKDGLDAINAWILAWTEKNRADRLRQAHLQDVLDGKKYRPHTEILPKET